jgi:hypothetical protein
MNPQPPTFHAHGQDWFPHTPGDPMPCNPNTQVGCLFKSGLPPFNMVMSAKDWHWTQKGRWNDVIGWRYASPDQPKAEPIELEKTMKPKPRPTPESDKAAREGAYFQHGDYAETCGKQLVHLETARRLERERDEARDLLILCTNLKEVQSMAAELEWLREENRLMRDAIKEAFDLLLDGENTRAGSTLQPFIKP